MESTIRWFSRNHVAANFLMAGVLVFGFVTWFKLKKEIFPETTIDAMSITVPYPNATPEEVETGIILPIEEAIDDLDGIDRITATAAEGMGLVNIEAKSNYDIRNLMNQVKARIDAIDNFAENAEEPVTEELLIKQQILTIAISAKTDEKTLRALAERVRDELLVYKVPKTVVVEKGGKEETVPVKQPLFVEISSTIRGEPGLTQVELANVRPFEISIEVSEDTLRSYGLSIERVANAVRSSSLDLPSGSVRTDAGEFLIRAEGKRYFGSDFADIPVITSENGEEVLLGSIAEIKDGFEEVDISSRFDQRPSILINVFRVGEEDTLELVSLVKSYLETARNRLPQGVSMEIWNDQSTFLAGRMDLLLRNGAMGLGLVVLVLALFLRPSLAFLVALGIPVAFCGAVWMMPFFDISINMITLFAFILVLGIVVDDAIVVGENVYSRMRMGEHPRQAAWLGTHEVGVVVIFGVLTTMVAFTPMLGVPGVSGKIWRNIPWIVIPTLAFSILQSKFVLPAHLALLKPSDPNKETKGILKLQGKLVSGLERFADVHYRNLLELALRNRYVVFSIFAAMLFVVMTFAGSSFMKKEFFPQVEADIVTAKLTLPKGVPFSETEKIIQRIEEAASRLNEKYRKEQGKPFIRHILSTSGSQPFQPGFVEGGVPTDSHFGEVTIELVPAEVRPKSAQVLSSEWRNETGTIPGVVELAFQSQATGGGNAIDLELSGKDPAQLEAAVEEVRSALAEFDGVIDIADSNRQGKREIKLRNLTPVGKSLGFRLEDVARQLRGGFYGDEVQRFQRGRNEVKVMVRYPEAERKSLSDVERIKLRTPTGQEVPLTEVAEFEVGRGFDTIRRVDLSRSIRVTADVDKTTDANANDIVKTLTEKTLVNLPAKYGVNFSFEGEQKDQRESVGAILGGFVFALLGMYVLMAIPLKSYVQPLIVMIAIPFGIVGAVIGHFIFQMELSIMSLCGIVALAGIVVNDSLVLVDYVNREFKRTGDRLAGAHEAGVRRFRPILLTSLTTFAGLTPMLLETDLQAKFLIPMAVSLSFGVLFATLITLILVPSVYLILDDAGHGAKWLHKQLQKLILNPPAYARWCEKAAQAEAQKARLLQEESAADKAHS